VEDYIDGSEHRLEYIFYALSQFSSGESKESVRTLINAILLLSPDTVKPFARGLQYYADELK
jgi:hypothetical protein